MAKGKIGKNKRKGWIPCRFELEVDGPKRDVRTLDNIQEGKTYQNLVFCCELPALPRVGDQVWLGKDNGEDVLDDPHVVESVDFYSYLDFVLIDLGTVQLADKSDGWTLESYCEMLIEAGFVKGDAFSFD